MRIIGNAGKAREVQAVASGALSTGDTVIVNTDGTVSVVAGSPTTVGTATSFSGTNDLNAGPQATFDSTNNKIVIVYNDGSNSGYGTAVVGTVSGSSISFGTPAVFNSAAIFNMDIAHDPTAGKNVIVYRDNGNSNRGTAIVGSVSGTSISFGAEAVFNSNQCQYHSVVYDSNAQKVVVVYADDGSPQYGGANVCTISGTSISFGSQHNWYSGPLYYVKATFDSNNNTIVVGFVTSNPFFGGTVIGLQVSGTSITSGSSAQVNAGNVTQYISIAYDANSTKTLMAYQDSSNSSYGTGVVVTVSGTNVSVGTEVVFSSASTKWIGSGYNAASGSVVVSYLDSTNGDEVRAVTASISGTTPSFSSPEVIYNASNVTFGETPTVYDSNSGKTVIAFNNSTDTYGMAAVFAPGSTNLTSDNYIGTAATGAPSGQGAKINIKGAVDESQSGLTAGQSYYVQADGTLGTTPADPSVFAGTAVAANKLIVKG